MTRSEFEKIKLIGELEDRIYEIIQSEKISLETEILNDIKYKEFAMPICRKIIDETNSGRFNIMFESKRKELSDSIEKNLLPELGAYINSKCETYHKNINRNIYEAISKFIENVPGYNKKDASFIRSVTLNGKNPEDQALEMSKIVTSDFGLAAVSTAGAIISTAFLGSLASGTGSDANRRNRQSPNPAGLLVLASISGLLLVAIKLLTTDLAEQLANIFGPKNEAVGVEPGIIYDIWHNGLKNKATGEKTLPLKKERNKDFDRVWHGYDSFKNPLTGESVEGYEGMKNILRRILD
jgi:hypothetical protein